MCVCPRCANAFFCSITYVRERDPDVAARHLRGIDRRRRVSPNGDGQALARESPGGTREGASPARPAYTINHVLCTRSCTRVPSTSVVLSTAEMDCSPCSSDCCRCASLPKRRRVRQRREGLLYSRSHSRAKARKVATRAHEQTQNGKDAFSGVRLMVPHDIGPSVGDAVDDGMHFHDGSVFGKGRRETLTTIKVKGTGMVYQPTNHQIAAACCVLSFMVHGYDVENMCQQSRSPVHLSAGSKCAIDDFRKIRLNCCPRDRESIRSNDCRQAWHQ